MRAVVVFCEGRHDVVFVQRSLGACASCKWIGDAIRCLPSPFGAGPTSMAGLVARRMQRRAVGDVALSAAASPPLPHFESVLELPDENTIVVLVRTHGKGQWKAVLELLRELDVTIGQEVAGTFEVAEYAAAFVFDANELGVTGTLAQFRDRYAEHFGDLSNARHGEWTATSRALVGCFVFHAEDGRGTLEDHLEPMAKAAWPDLYDEARKFIDDNMRSGHAVWQNSARRTKAVVTAAGQFDCPGEPLSSVIGREGLPRQQFRESSVCQTLTRFLTEVPWGQDGRDPETTKL